MKNGREHLLPEHAQAQANPWQVSWLVAWLCSSSLVTKLVPPRLPSSLELLCSFVQGLFDLVNKVLNEAGAANAHDVYVNLYPASTGRLRPHQDGKQVKLTWLSMVVMAVCCLLSAVCCLFIVRYVQSEYSLFKCRQ